MTETTAAVGIIMGSQSDWETMRHAAETLETLGVPFETRIVSAHRTPRRLYAYAEEARERGLKVIVAGAGGAAHLPGMTASMTPLPVIGVPVESKSPEGDGQPALHRPDAGRRARRHGRHWTRRRGQRGVACRRHRGARR